MIHSFNAGNFHSLCDTIAKKDGHFASIIRQYGYPPMWTRRPGFATLIHIILEQQVSLASARAAFEKLKATIGTVTPAKLLALSDVEMKACYFSRQKTLYARHLAQAVVSKQLQLKKLQQLPDDTIRDTLIQIKGIGNWTVDVYMLFVLQRPDLFPVGDLAMINALKEIKQLPKQIAKVELMSIAEKWRPYRSIATMLLWHYYIKTRNIKF